jgi:flagellar M-ring protein FliF
VPAAGGTGRKEETVSYEVDRSIQHTKAQIGGIKRLTAAVVINNRHKVDDKGVATATPIPAAELEQFNALVREAMGYSKERGDSLNVVNAAFNEGEKEPVVELPLWKQPENIALAKEVGRYTLFAALAAYLFFGVLRPLLRHATRPATLPLVAAGAGTAALSGPAGSPELAQPLAASGDTLQLARKIARDDPKIVANVVKQWVTQDE